MAATMLATSVRVHRLPLIRYRPRFDTPCTVLTIYYRPLTSSVNPRGGPGNPPPKSSIFSLPRIRRFARFTGFFLLSSTLGILAIGAGIFIHDAFTYTDKHVERVPDCPLTLYPEPGGPKNLPIVRAQVDDEEDEESRTLFKKPYLVIVGCGWGAVSVLEKLHPGDYHVTVISSETYSTFTPLLPSAAVGTVQVRSLIEPIRKIIARLYGHYVHGDAVDVDMSHRLLEVGAFMPTGETVHVYIPYDKLIIACGSVSSTHGVPGLENCFQLKTVSDAQQIRRRILDNFEAASLPTTTPEERKGLLSFVICGGGPTGVETAAEIYDLCQEDIMSYFPKICREEVSIHIVQSREHILNTYTEAISRYAEEKFKRDRVDLITSARVKSVHPTHVVYTKRSEDGRITEHAIPNNFVLWSTGIAMNPFTERVCEVLPNQVHKKAIEVDAYLRVKGAPLGTVYAVGDCSTIETNLVDHLLELVEESGRNADGNIDLDEWRLMVQKIKQKIPMAGKHLEKIRTLFELYDLDKDNALTLDELSKLLRDLSNKMTALPATAQVASQEGKYLGRKLTKLARRRHVLAENQVPHEAADEAIMGPFKYRHLGSLAYIGNAAVFDLEGTSFMGGLAAMYAWRSIYWSEQVSARTRALLMIDWIVRGVWGRDLSRL